jgi:hypothetical protein
MYAMVPVTHNDGLDASYRFTTGSLAHNVQVTMGRSDSSFPSSSGFEPGEAKARELVAANLATEMGYATLRLSAGKANLTIDSLRPFFDAFRQFGPAGAAIADKYSLDDRRVTFVGVGASYDPGRWFAMAEWARFDTRSVVGRKSAWYVSGGHRISKFTPYATYASLKAESETSDPGLPLAGLPPEAAAAAAFLNATLNSQLAIQPTQKTASLGVRWDFAKNAALKVQYDHIRLGASSRGTFGNVQPGFQLGGTVRIVSAAVDFVF